MDWVEVILESRRMVTSLGVALKLWNKTENYGTFWLQNKCKVVKSNRLEGGENHFTFRVTNKYTRMKCWILHNVFEVKDIRTTSNGHSGVSIVDYKHILYNIQFTNLTC